MTTQSKQKIRHFIADYLRTLSAKRVVWKTMSGDFTAAQMIQLLEAGDETALVWLTSILRVFRDVFIREAEIGYKLRKEKITVNTNNLELGPFKHLLNESGESVVVFDYNNIQYTKVTLPENEEAFEQWCKRILAKTLKAL